jgi:hypothetical protein
MCVSFFSIALVFNNSHSVRATTYESFVAVCTSLLSDFIYTNCNVYIQFDIIKLHKTRAVVFRRARNFAKSDY